MLLNRTIKSNLLLYLNPMNKCLNLFLVLLFLYSCNAKPEIETANKATIQDSLAPLQVTVIAHLPSSLQPKSIALESMPKPLTVTIPNQVGGSYSIKNEKGDVKKINLTPPIYKALAVLQNEKGETVLDAEGKPFIMGDGGKSNFTNFTTDNGLALDAIGSSKLDKAGNLWFGTLGGGVSKYDGKSFTNFTTAQGLVNNNVRSITEDKSGNIWIGTGGGVSKYDGKSFTNYTTAHGLVNNSVWSIIEDKIGNIWFGTWGGISKYDGNRIETIQQGENVPLRDQQDLKKDKNGHLVKSFTSFTTAQGLTNNSVNWITEDKSGNLWFGTYGGGVSKYDGKSFINFTTAQGLANNVVWGIAEDKTGNLWFGTDGGGVSRYDGKSFTTFNTAQGLANNIVWSIAVDKIGNLWFGTDGGGVSRYDGKSFASFTTSQGLANNIVYTIIEDKTGNLWFGTLGGGVSKYDGKSFTSFTTSQGLANNSVYSITEDKSKNLWFGTGSGVSKYDGKSFTNFTIAQGLANNNVNCITEDKFGNLWLGTYGGGVSKYDGKSFANFTTAQGLANNNVHCITEDKSGNLWFGTFGGGVSKYDIKTFTNFTTAQGLANNNINCITLDGSGNLWFGTFGGGVSKYDGKSFTNFTTAQGLVNNNVHCITEDKSGNLWFGTGDGISILTVDMLKEKLDEKHVLSGIEGKGKGNISEKIFKRFQIADGLPDNFVTNITKLPNGKMAVFTNLGITFFKVSKDFTKLTDLEIYNATTGYPLKDVNGMLRGDIGARAALSHALFESGTIAPNEIRRLEEMNCMLLDNKGIIWAGAGSEKTALVRFDYMALQKNIEPPNLVIQSVKVKNENICWYNLQSKGVIKNYQDSASTLLQEFFAYGKTLSTSQNDLLLNRFGNIQFNGITKFYPLPDNLILPYEHNQIAFEFTAIETGRPFLVKYQYILEGYDKDWSPITSQSNANFGNIKEGKYTFKVKAQGANGVWSNPITYTFKVVPPYYRAWWAYLIYFILFLGALRIFSKLRERHLNAQKEKLEKKVEDRTAEVEKQKEELVQKNIVIENEKNEADRQRQRSDSLLLNILPEEVAEELKHKGSAEAKQFNEVTVLFTDFKDFTQLSEKMTAKELVAEIHTCFMAFDNIIEKYGVEKIKTIGDSYMCAGGLPVANKTHAVDVVSAALDIQQFVNSRLAEKTASGKEHFQVRIGIHTGSVVAGIVGIKKFAYDIWGDTVNTASRMESNSEAGQVNISSATYELVKDKFKCNHRGKIQVKGKGELHMYFVEGRI